MVCERAPDFGYIQLVSTCRSLAIMRAHRGAVVFDATPFRAVARRAGTASGGQREFVPVLARRPRGRRSRGHLMETHPEPAKALVGRPNAWPLDRMRSLLTVLKEIDAARNRGPTRIELMTKIGRHQGARDR